MSAQSQPPQHQSDSERHRAVPAEALAQSVRQIDAAAGGAAREVRASSLAHPTARPRRQRAVLNLQRTSGNQHVTGLLQREDETEFVGVASEEVAAEPSTEQISETAGFAGEGGGGEAPTESGGGEQEQPVEEMPSPVEMAPEEPIEAPGGEEAPVEEVGEVAGEETEQEPAEEGSEQAGGGLIVGDDVAEPGPGQMRQSDFLAQVRGVATTAVEGVLGGTPLMVLANEEIEAHLGQYRAMSPAGLEQTVQREVPGSAGATSAADYLPMIAGRVRAAAEQSGGASGMLDEVASAAGGLISGIGNLLFKEREGGARDGADPRAIQAQLGPGEPLGGRTGSGLSAAFGQDFSSVRVHTDSRAAELSARLNARAFTVGRDVAFGEGEFRPGTLTGDALIAHELAHVAQQGATTAAGPLAKSEGEVDAFEEDADRSAVGAVASLWGGMKSGLANVSQQALPRLRTGLRLQRCGGGKKETPAPPVPTKLIPFDRAPKSRPGERIIFNSQFTHDTPGEFQLVYTGDGGTFDTSNGPVTKTVSGLTSGNVDFFIDAGWNGSDAVTVKLEVQRVADGTAVHTADWSFSGKGTTPTTITQEDAETERPLGSRYAYKVGPDLNADGTDDYISQTILERFGPKTCNIAVADLKPEFLAAHPAIKTDADITAHFFGGASNNGTFTVSAGDKIFDRHSGGMPDLATFTAALTTMKEIQVDLPQTYEVEPSISLGNYTIRRILKVDGTKMMRKMRAP